MQLQLNPLPQVDWTELEREYRFQVHLGPPVGEPQTARIVLDEVLVDAVQRPPAPACAGCGRALCEIGGRRIAVFRNGVVSENGTLVLSGNCWDTRSIPRAVAHFRRGQTPWLCQFCAETFRCEECQWPLWYPGGAEVVGDDGTLGHCGLLPVGGAGCLNPDCVDWHGNKRSPGRFGKR